MAYPASLHSATRFCSLVHLVVSPLPLVYFLPNDSLLHLQRLTYSALPASVRSQSKKDKVRFCSLSRNQAEDRDGRSSANVGKMDHRSPVGRNEMIDVSSQRLQKRDYLYLVDFGWYTRFGIQDSFHLKRNINLIIETEMN